MTSPTKRRIPTLIYFDAPQRERLAETARANERSVTAEVRFAVARHLEHTQSKAA